jgi:hypothetical protein
MSKNTVIKADKTNKQAEERKRSSAEHDNLSDPVRCPEHIQGNEFTGLSQDSIREMLVNSGSDVERSNLALQLQRTYGNAFVQRLLAPRMIQCETPSVVPASEAAPVSQPVPGLPDELVTKCEQLITAGDARSRQEAVDLIVNQLAGTGEIDLSIIDGRRMRYDPSMGDEGHTRGWWESTPDGGARPLPSTIEIGPPAFQSVSWLFTAIDHEWQHTFQYQTLECREESETAHEVDAYLRGIEKAQQTGASVDEVLELWRRLRDEQWIEIKSPSLRALYQSRYDAAENYLNSLLGNQNLSGPTGTAEQAGPSAIQRPSKPSPRKTKSPSSPRKPGYNDVGVSPGAAAGRGMYVEPLLSEKSLQAKLTVSRPDDPYEIEADNVAKAVMQTAASIGREGNLEEEEPLQAKISRLQRQSSVSPEEEEIQTKGSAVQRSEPEEEEIQAKASGIQRNGLEEEEMIQGKISEISRADAPEEEEIQAKSADAQPEVSENLENRINSSRGLGQPLADSARKSLEPGFGSDFNDVKVHTGAEADTLSRQLKAEAFTVGKDIFFKEGRYQPETDDGKKLIAHELTHVIQQEGTG